jgi:Zn-dependent peptidase ImmA (M78 family)
MQLDPVELDGKFSPEDVVAEIYRQNPAPTLPIPVEELAAQAGIIEINGLQDSAGFEGALVVADEMKSRGSILFNAVSPRPKQRFTIAHELGHFLLPTHRLSTYQCSTDDMGTASGPQGTRASTEAEANRFAAELLLPKRLFKQSLRSMGEPELEALRDLATVYGTSMEATANRMARLSDYPCAVVYAKGTVVRYCVSSPELPYSLVVGPGRPLPIDGLARSWTDACSAVEATEPESWLAARRGIRLPVELFEQVYAQSDGYSITLIYADDLPDDDDE